MTGLLLIIIYIIGFILTILFFNKFGKKIGFDWSNNCRNSDIYYDDWESNTQAYTSFSLAWFIIMPILAIIGFWKILTYLTNKIIKD